MAIAFPASPSVNDTYTYGTSTWTWTERSGVGYWKRNLASDVDTGLPDTQVAFSNLGVLAGTACLGTVLIPARGAQRATRPLPAPRAGALVFRG